MTTGIKENTTKTKILNLISKILLGISLTAIPIGFDRWSGMYDSLLGQFHQNLPDVLIIGLIILGGFGGIYGYLTSKKKQESSQVLVGVDPYDKKEHYTTLNEIYKKLSKVSISENDDNTCNLVIPQNYDEYKKNESIVRATGQYITPTPRINTEKLGLDLQRANIHLEQNAEYKKIVEYWNQLERLVKKYNKNTSALVNFVEGQLHTIMKRETDFNEYHIDQERGYNIKNLRKVVLLALYINKKNKTDYFLQSPLRIEKIGNIHVWDQNINDYGDGSLIIVPREDKEPDVKKIQKLLDSFVKDQEIINKYQPDYELFEEIRNKCKEFSKKIQPLIDKIENHGYVVEGKCDLGY